MENTLSGVAGKKFILSYSCGKDSTLCLHKMLEAGAEPMALLVMFNPEAGRSYFHGVDPALLKEYGEALELGYRCLIKTLDRRVLPRHLLGRVMDRAMVEEMTACGVDICGENGEFHTIAVDGPVFHRPIPYCVRQLLDLGDYSVADITVPEKE